MDKTEKKETEMQELEPEEMDKASGGVYRDVSTKDNKSCTPDVTKDLMCKVIDPNKKSKHA